MDNRSKRRTVKLFTKVGVGISKYPNVLDENDFMRLIDLLTKHNELEVFFDNLSENNLKSFFKFIKGMNDDEIMGFIEIIKNLEKTM